MRAARAQPPRCTTPLASTFEHCDFSGALQLSDHYSDSVARLGTIDMGYFYSAVWLEGKDNDYNTCIILKRLFLLPSALHTERVRGCPIYPNYKDTFALQY